ncbi:MAG: cyclic nucleotide-binding domain-containing protein, partial [Alphaproteobacteria bacterium]
MHNLDKIELLSELTREERAALGTKCSWRTFRAGEQILERASDSRDMFFVVEGNVNIVNYGSTGREVIYATIGEGQY